MELRYRRAGGVQATAAWLEEPERLQLAEVSFRTLDGARLRFERASVPTAQQAILDSFAWPIPARFLPPNLDTETIRWWFRTRT